VPLDTSFPRPSLPVKLVLGGLGLDVHCAWPSREDEFADRFNQMPKYVVSSTLGEPEWSNSTSTSCG
jgi:hypothetical protein